MSITWSKWRAMNIDALSEAYASAPMSLRKLQIGVLRDEWLFAPWYA